MKKINLKGLDTDAYTEKLSNGLEIFMLPYSNKKNYFISYATRFGSDVLEFIDNDGNKFVPPLGIAHFLEHKMFEQEDGVDPFAYFSESGTDGNASTSFEYTQYICYGTKEFNKNLSYLLKFVNNPYYTDENVEKEKGIIAEEINMYADIPDFKLEMELRKAVYKNSPRRIDIAGTVPEIMKITKEDLYACYNNFYSPNNMFVLIVGNFNPEEAVSIIKKELEEKENKPKVKIVDTKEPLKVNEKEIILKETIEVPKIALGLKIPTNKLSMNDLELDLYLNILTTIMFGASSEFREKVRNEKLLSSIYTEWETIKGYRTFYLMAATINPDELLKKVKEELNNPSVSKKAFERIKKVWIANEVKMIDSIDSTYSNLYDDILKYKRIIPNKLDIIRKMKVEKLNELIDTIDFKNISIVKMLKNEE